MIFKKLLLAFSGALFLAGCAQTSAPSEDIVEVPFTKIHFADKFWSPRIETNRTVTIPAALFECDKNGRFDNFAVAAGLLKKEHQGDFSFDDTDPYKVIEGASYSLAVKYDAALDHRLDSLITLIAGAQEEDGYLCTCVTNKCYRLSGWWGTSRWEKINSHELYNCGHLYEAAVAHFQATGKRTLLDVAIKNADLVCEVFGLGENQIHFPSGHPIIEMALVKLYKVTGDEKYLNEARYFVEEAGRGTGGRPLSQYSQDHKPVLEQDEILGHAVRAGYFYSGVADVAMLTRDTAYFNALYRIWDNMASKKLYITGGIGSRAQGEGFGPNYELHNQESYCETCAAISNVFWNYRMFLATGESKYIDVLERALYNGVISGVSLEGNTFFYDNPLESMGQHERQRWFGCACCPGNVTRFMASIPNYMYAVRGNDIYVNLFAGSTAEVPTKENVVALEQNTEYPWNGNIKISVNPATAAKFALCLRIPGWAQNSPVPSDLYSYTAPAGKYSIKVNGKKVRGKLQDGYAVVSRSWKEGDVVEIDFPMDIRRVKANDLVEDDRGKLAIERGPVVYCLEGKDQEGGTVFDKFIPEDAVMTASFEDTLLRGVVVIKGDNFKAIPYSTWNNRGADQMAVWIPVSEEYAQKIPEPTIASQAHSYIERGQWEEWAWGVNDQWEPKRSSDNSKPYLYWWLKFGTKENVAYKFDKPYEVSSVQVYWLDLDHYDGNFRVPQSWKLYYRDGRRWKEVEALNEYGVEKDQYNVLNFKPVTTDGLKIEAQLQDKASGGVIEWKVN